MAVVEGLVLCAAWGSKDIVVLHVWLEDISRFLTLTGRDSSPVII